MRSEYVIKSLRPPQYKIKKAGLEPILPDTDLGITLNVLVVLQKLAVVCRIAFLSFPKSTAKALLITFSLQYQRIRSPILFTQHHKLVKIKYAVIISTKSPT